MKTKSIQDLLLIILVVLVAYGLIWQIMRSDPPAESVGRPAPPIEAAGWVNGTPPPPDERAGKVIVLEAWASW